MAKKNLTFNLKDPIRAIEGWPEYFISRDGILYSCKRTHRAFLSGGLYQIKPKLSSRGYPEAGLFRTLDDGTKQRKFIRIHQLVANAWVEKPSDWKDKVYEPNHKNGIKTDNRADNLEWMTRSDNVLHSYHVLGREKLLRSIYYDGILYNSIIECCKRNGFNQKSVNTVLSRGQAKFKGKPISYAEPKARMAKTII